LHKSKETTTADRVIENPFGNLWMTANMAFDRKVFDVYKFDESFALVSDRDLALRVIKKFGSIPFLPSMIVYHQQTKWTFKSIMRFFKNQAIAKIFMIKKYNDLAATKYFVYKPMNLLIIFFPILSILRLTRRKIKTYSDLKCFLYWILALYLERYYLWKTAVKEKVFII